MIVSAGNVADLDQGEVAGLVDAGDDSRPTGVGAFDLYVAVAVHPQVTYDVEVCDHPFLPRWGGHSVQDIDSWMSRAGSATLTGSGLSGSSVRQCSLGVLSVDGDRSAEQATLGQPCSLCEAPQGWQA